MVVLLQACDATLLKGFDNHLIGGFCVGLSSDRNAAHDDDDGDLVRCDESRCLFYGTTLRATRRKSLLPRDSTHLPKSPPASGEKRSRSELVAASGENARSEGKKKKRIHTWLDGLPDYSLSNRLLLCICMAWPCFQMGRCLHAHGEMLFVLL